MDTETGLAGLAEGDCAPGCPVEAASAVLGGKWTTLIVRELVGGTRRYSELQRALDGISPRMLAARLRFLEESGVVARTVYPTVPPGTAYALTPLGRELEHVIAALATFGLKLQAAADDS